jgi:hypothetical protein
VSKTVEAVNTIRQAGASYAGLQGGTVIPSTASELAALGKRGLLPVTTATWVIAGAGSAGDTFTITDVQFDVSGNSNVVSIGVSTPATEQATDVYNSYRNDPNLLKAGTFGGGAACTTDATAITGTTVQLCFRL